MLKMLCIIGDLWLILWPTPLTVALPEVLVLSLSLSLLTVILFAFGFQLSKLS